MEEPHVTVAVPQSLIYEIILTNKTTLGNKHKICSDLFNLICQRNNLHNVVLSPRIERLLRVRITRFLGRYKKCKNGGKQKQLFEKWMEGNIWQFKIFYFEYQQHKVMEENKALSLKLLRERIEAKKVKRKLKLKERQAKKYRKALISWSKKHLNKVKQRRNRISDKQYSVSQIYRLKRQLKQNCFTALLFLEDQGYEAKQVILGNKHTGETENISLSESPEDTQESQVADLEQLNLAMLVKSRFNVSDATYNAFAKIISDLPKLTSLKKHMAEADNTIPIRVTPCQNVGVQRDMKILIEKNVALMVESGVLEEGSLIKVKVSGDGTKVGKYIHFVIISLVFLNNLATVNSPYGNHAIAILNDDESYDSLAEHLADIVRDIEVLTEVTYKEITYNIEYYLSGDYKFLLTVCGLQSANSNHPCLYCEQESKTFFDQNVKGSPRTVRSIEAQSKKRSKGCAKVPIFRSIPVERIVIDILHMFLRVTDVLISLLIFDLRTLDAIEKIKSFKEFNPDQYTHLAAYQSLLTSLGINGFTFYVGKESKSLKYRELTGPEKQKLFKNVDRFRELLSGLDTSRVEKIIQIWTEYMRLHKTLTKMGTVADEDVTPNQFKDKAQNWLKLFLSVYQSKNVTPYMHLLISHAAEIVARHGSLSHFSTQGLEKLNALTTLDYFKGTNHKLKGTALCQIMHKHNRLSWLSFKNVKLKKQILRCSKCKQQGHNCRTCIQEE